MRRIIARTVVSLVAVIVLGSVLYHSESEDDLPSFPPPNGPRHIVNIATSSPSLIPASEGTTAASQDAPLAAIDVPLPSSSSSRPLLLPARLLVVQYHQRKINALRSRRLLVRLSTRNASYSSDYESLLTAVKTRDRDATPDHRGFEKPSNLEQSPHETTWHVCLQVRNAAYMLPEWLEFHALMGMTHLTVYDHESTRNESLNTLNVLQRFLDGSDGDPQSLPRLQIEYLTWPPSVEVEAELWTQRHIIGKGFTREMNYTADQIEDVRRPCVESLDRPKSEHQSTDCQRYSYRDCYSRYLGRRTVMSNHDVDEFIWVWRPLNSTLNETELRREVEANTSATTAHLVPMEQLVDYSVPLFMLRHHWREVQSGTSLALQPLNFGNPPGVEELDPGTLLMNSSLHRSPYEELGEPEVSLARQMLLCRGPKFGPCARTFGKAIHFGHMTLAADGFKPFSSIHSGPREIRARLNRNDTRQLRLHHHKWRSLAEGFRMSRLQQKGEPWDNARGTSGFTNAVYDPSALVVYPTVRARMHRRRTLELKKELDTLIYSGLSPEAKAQARADAERQRFTDAEWEEHRNGVFEDNEFARQIAQPVGESSKRKSSSVGKIPSSKKKTHIW